MYEEKREKTTEEITREIKEKIHCKSCKGTGWLEIAVMVSTPHINHGQEGEFVLGMTKCQHTIGQPLDVRMNYRRLKTHDNKEMRILIERMEREGTRFIRALPPRED